MRFRRPASQNGPYCSADCYAAARAEQREDRRQVRFDAYVTRTPGCWLWSGWKDRYGYGQFQWAKGRSVQAHRVAWILANGPIPPGHWVLHRCPDGSRRDCVNPAHLSLGGAQENAADRQREGRGPAGARHYRARFSEAQAAAIRARYAAGGVTQAALAQEFGVCKATIGHVVTHRTYTHSP